MTIDDESSVYVGGLPYNATEDTIRKVFDFYGSVVAVKIVNDRGTRGKCYGFVTFANPRSAVDAIKDMNGRTIDGRVVRVNEVTTRGGKSNFGRGHFRHSDWDKGRDRGRGNDRYKERHWDHHSDRSRELSPSRDSDKDKERGYEHPHDRDPSRDDFSDRDQGRDVEDNELGHIRSHDQEWDRNSEFDQNQDREIDGNNVCHISTEKGKDYSRKLKGELSSNSADDYNDQVKEQLDRSIQKREELKKEITQLEERLDGKEQLVSDLQKRSKKLEDALITAKKLSSHRQKQLTKLYKCFMQVKESAERLRSCEQEFQSMVDVAMIESEMGDDVGLKEGGVVANGINA